MPEFAPLDLIKTQIWNSTENLVAEMTHCSVRYLFLHKKAIENGDCKGDPSNVLVVLILMKSYGHDYLGCGS